ncbi:hypothetical protein DPMN_084954 [Dreissena polymorpha]|uniref:Uncharacterized protein n=1 Tax=Dreissena polymorpha TaxID=45954 RepID=A0A9D3YCQ7_DREPO|nr:hypothetical protein DPMN_084954 [Dreissena polymorpha]
MADAPIKIDFTLKQAMGADADHIEQMYDEFKIVKSQLYLTSFVEASDAMTPGQKKPFEEGKLQGCFLTCNDISPITSANTLAGMHQMAGVRFTRVPTMSARPQLLNTLNYPTFDMTGSINRFGSGWISCGVAKDVKWGAILLGFEYPLRSGTQFEPTTIVADAIYALKHTILFRGMQ